MATTGACHAYLDNQTELHHLEIIGRLTTRPNAAPEWLPELYLNKNHTKRIIEQEALIVFYRVHYNGRGSENCS